LSFLIPEAWAVARCPVFAHTVQNSRNLLQILCIRVREPGVEGAECKYRRCNELQHSDDLFQSHPTSPNPTQHPHLICLPTACVTVHDLREMCRINVGTGMRPLGFFNRTDGSTGNWPGCYQNPLECPECWNYTTIQHILWRVAHPSPLWDACDQSQPMRRERINRRSRRQWGFSLSRCQSFDDPRRDCEAARDRVPVFVSRIVFPYLLASTGRAATGHITFMVLVLFSFPCL
jgi:hypothetical protein